MVGWPQSVGQLQLCVGTGAPLLATKGRTSCGLCYKLKRTVLFLRFVVGHTHRIASLLNQGWFHPQPALPFFFFFFFFFFFTFLSLRLFTMAEQAAPPCRKQVDVLHPDFGLGGAEALMRDVVLALEGKESTVRVFTSHYDRERCFVETRNMDVRVFGSFLPRHVCQKFHIFFATGRAAYCALRAAALGRHTTDVYVCDQISAYVLFLRLLTSRPVLFYCHFPDRLLVQNTSRGLLGRLKQLYRVPFDAFEEFTTGTCMTPSFCAFTVR